MMFQGWLLDVFWLWVAKKWACFNSWPSVKAALMFRVVGSGLNISDRANIRMPVTIPRFQIELRHRMHWGLRASTNYGQSDPQCNDGVFDVISLQDLDLLPLFAGKRQWSSYPSRRPCVGRKPFQGRTSGSSLSRIDLCFADATVFQTNVATSKAGSAYQPFHLIDQKQSPHHPQHCHLHSHHQSPVLHCLLHLSCCRHHHHLSSGEKEPLCLALQLQLEVVWAMHLWGDDWMEMDCFTKKLEMIWYDGMMDLNH